MIDTRPGVPDDQRYKALAGVHTSGLAAFVSADGLRWRKLQEKPVLESKAFAFDSQNVSFWSPSEECYVCYFRSWNNDVRWISRTTSRDYVNWTPPVAMEFRHGDGPAHDRASLHESDGRLLPRTAPLRGDRRAVHARPASHHRRAGQGDQRGPGLLQGHLGRGAVDLARGQSLRPDVHGGLPPPGHRAEKLGLAAPTTRR